VARLPACPHAARLPRHHATSAQSSSLTHTPTHSPQRLCKRLLESQGGYEVLVADDGDVALQQLIDSYAPGGTPVDFVLMDLQARPLLLMHDAWMHC
jgi:hypothetical protein